MAQCSVSYNNRRQFASALRASAGRLTSCTFCAGRYAPIFAQNAHKVIRPCCGRYVQQEILRIMRILGLIFSALLVTSCVEDSPLIASIPTTSSCAKSALEQVEVWSEKFEGTNISFEAKHKSFTLFQHASSPVTGYIEVRSNMLEKEVDPYLNKLASLCLLQSRLKISKDGLGYRIVADEIVKNIESGVSPILAKDLGAEIELNYSASE